MVLIGHSVAHLADDARKATPPKGQHQTGYLLLVCHVPSSSKRICDQCPHFRLAQEPFLDQRQRNVPA